MTINQNPGSYIEVAPGVDIYYEERGSGDPLLFIPGWTFTTELFEQQLAHFSKSHRAIAIDPRSHGRSTVTLHGNDYATHGVDLAQIIAHLELKNVVLIGWSFGCLNSWAYVRQNGLDNLKAVVSVDLSPRPLSVNTDDWVEGPVDEIGGAYNTFLTSPKGQRDFVAWYATEVMVQRDLSEAELAWIVEQSGHTPYYVAALLFAGGMFSDYMAEAKQIDESLPALNIVAEHWADTATAFTKKHFPTFNTHVVSFFAHLYYLLFVS